MVPRGIALVTVQEEALRLKRGGPMMPLGAPSISKFGSLVRPHAQIVVLRAHCA